MPRRRKIIKTELVLPFGMEEQIREYLFEDTSKEYLCYLLCGHAYFGRTLRLLGCYLVIPDEEDYESKSLTHVRIKRSFLISILNECEKLGLSLIDIHSHPFASDSVNFSSIDDADEQEKASWFKENLPNCFFGSIVMGRNSHQSRIYLPHRNLEESKLTIWPIKAPLIPKDSQRSFDSATYQRQILAFGKKGQKVLANVRVGVVGLGGLGAEIVEKLARLGIKRFVLIDHDRTEKNNLNRLTGATTIDAKLNNYKVDLVARNLLEIDSGIECFRIRKDVTIGTNWRRLRNVDLLVVTTDNHKSRMFLNIISQLYLIPQISLGTLISTNEEEEFDGAHGHVFITLPGHNQPCPLCADIINVVELYYEISSQNARKQARDGGYVKNFEIPAPAVVHLNGVLASLASVEIHNLFCNFKEVKKHMVYSMESQEIFTINEKDRNCACCSQGGGIFGRGDLITKPFEDIDSIVKNRS